MNLVNKLEKHLEDSAHLNLSDEYKEKVGEMTRNFNLFNSIIDDAEKMLALDDIHGSEDITLLRKLIVSHKTTISEINACKINFLTFLGAFYPKKECGKDLYSHFDNLDKFLQHMTERLQDIEMALIDLQNKQDQRTAYWRPIAHSAESVAKAISDAAQAQFMDDASSEKFSDIIKATILSEVPKAFPCTPEASMDQAQLRAMRPHYFEFLHQYHKAFDAINNEKTLQEKVDELEKSLKSKQNQIDSMQAQLSKTKAEAAQFKAINEKDQVAIKTRDDEISSLRNELNKNGANKRTYFQAFSGSISSLFYNEPGNPPQSSRADYSQSYSG